MSTTIWNRTVDTLVPRERFPFVKTCGLSRAGVLGLKREGFVVLRTSDYQLYADEKSLSAYLNRS